MKISRGASNFLNFSRWAAAGLVMISHVRSFIFVDYKHAMDKTPLLKAFYFVTDLGHEAVVIFFVISGFLVGGLSLGRGLKKGFSLGSYFAHRFARIYTVYIPALVAGGVLDYIGYLYFNASGLYTNPASYHISTLQFVTAERLNFRSFLGNVFMLQGSYVEQFGSNGPLWSLANEWWYYCIFSIVFFIFLSKSKKVWAGGLALVLLISLFVSHAIFLWMTVWMLGIISWAYWQSSLPKPHPLVGLVAFLIAIVGSRLSHGSQSGALSGNVAGIMRDLCLGIGYSLFLTSMLAKDTKPFLEKINGKLASFSYTLYLVHFPALLIIVNSMKSVFGQNFLLQPSLYTFCYATFIITILEIYAFSFYLLTEAHTDHVRHWLERYRLKISSVSQTP